VISFLPVFFMLGVPGRLFFPLAFTKTVIMIAAVVLALVVLPPFAYMLFGGAKTKMGKAGRGFTGVLILASGVVTGLYLSWVVGTVVGVVGGYTLIRPLLSSRAEEYVQKIVIFLIAGLLTYLLARVWMPLGLEAGVVLNVFAVFLLVVLLMTALAVVYWNYEVILRCTLSYRLLFCVLTAGFLVAGYMAWQDLGKEFRPDLEEGSFLFMPIMSYHGSTSEAIEGVQRMDRLIETIPEVEESIGKAGRARTALDPAPLGMLETIVHYKPEFKEDEDGNVLRFRYNPDHPDAGEEGFVRDREGQLIRDPDGRPYRQWRDHIRSPDDIWEEVVEVADLPGWTEPSKVQPIETRLLMLQTGLRAPIGIKVYSSDIQTAEDVAMEMEDLLRDVPAVKGDTVQADRLVGKGYLEIDVNRKATARHGVSIEQVQNIIEVAIGGKEITRTVEGRERYGVRVRYKRELRDSLEGMKNMLVPAQDGAQIPLKQLADFQFRRGPQVIRGEDGRPVVYISFSQKEDVAEVQAVEQAKAYIKERIQENQLILPAGTSYSFAGSYQQQEKAQKVLSVLLPLSLLLIVVILYLQHRSLSTTLMVFSGIVVAWAGGFVLIWLYGQDWFMHVSLLGIDMRNLLNIQEYNLSIAVWVGFLVLFGIATDHGVLVATKLDQDFRDQDPTSPGVIKEITVEAALQRIRPQIMMLGITIFALLPVITSSGKGSNTMIPMALPSFGGMAAGLLTILIVPLLYANVEEFRLRTGMSKNSTELISVVSLFTVPLIYNEFCSILEDFRSEE
jgi:Cu(I)/Ag(I) efflux system membrane protein CusA/SilA